MFASPLFHFPLCFASLDSLCCQNQALILNHVVGLCFVLKPHHSIDLTIPCTQNTPVGSHNLPTMTNVSEATPVRRADIPTMI
ncbi:uncharacterized protein EDB91DRAFT_1144571 [Suillus paluster]|uniref:uncharacterized protein n=1 Tax=Suillus paluster TaxID=48578 RepID=UPI001B885C8A|nr:uncharacterized protein EDB91DRAFT_1144571 [Suillus paluster]KAG1735649.1 hypothetical protein EDB91DRAFT_1144571 [Suillus paluster]